MLQQSHLRLRYIDRDLGAAHGARCMDGSAGGLYFTPAASAANRSRLVIFIEGGGECRTLLSCATWAFRAGSSSNWPTTMELPEADMFHAHSDKTLPKTPECNTKNFSLGCPCFCEK